MSRCISASPIVRPAIRIAQVAKTNGSELRANLRASFVEGAAHGSMVGWGETFLAAFVLAVGLGEVTAGLVTTAPMIFGGLVQLISPFGVRWLGSHKRWVVVCAGLQAAAFVPLIIAALLEQIGPAMVLAIVGLYWASGLATGAAWNTWIGTIVPSRVRHRFFAHRTRASQCTILAGFISGGLILECASSYGHALTGFAVLFALAAMGRIVSVLCLMRQSEPSPQVDGMTHLPWRGLVAFVRTIGCGRLLVYLIAMQAAVQISGPYFAPFLFKKLQLSYGQYVLLLSLSFLGKIIAMPLWGRLSQRIGVRRLLWIGGVGIIPSSALWIASQNFVWISGLQILSGVFWAAYELGFFLMFFESIDPKQRTSVLTYYNLFNMLAWVTGSLLGGLFLVATGATFYSYLALFGMSSLGRALGLFLLARVPPPEFNSSNARNGIEFTAWTTEKAARPISTITAADRTERIAA